MKTSETKKTATKIAQASATKTPVVTSSSENGLKPKSAPDQAGAKKLVKKFEINLSPSSFFNNILLMVFLALLFVPFLSKQFGLADKDIVSISQLVTDVRDKKVQKIEVTGQDMKLFYTTGESRHARKEDSQQVVDVLIKSGVDLKDVSVIVKDVSLMDMGWQLLLNLLPILVMGLVFLFLFQQARGAQEGLMGFGRSKAKVFIKGKQDTKFTDVGGMVEAKKELEEIVDFLKNSKKYTKIGARTPKGVLLVGPPGTGKTLLARAVAGEANVQFLSMAGSEFMEMMVGVGASRVRDLFSSAKRLAPSIIFIDEIDAIGRARGASGMASHDEREQTLNQILVEMDGFTPNDNVIVMAATNRGDMLDPALVRPGRFDRRVQLSLPDLGERKFILSIHAKGKSFTGDINWERITRQTVGFSGADIENMLNEAAISAVRDNREAVVMKDIEEAGLKVKLGPSKKRLVDDIERKMTAYHEAGHALIAHLSPHADPVSRISILSRGNALGFTFTPPEKDKLQITKSELLDQIMVLLGGRTAEKLVFGELTAGASSDIERATLIARAMVIDYGMSDLGPINFGPVHEVQGYSRMMSEPSRISDRLQEKVDDEVSKVIHIAMKKAEVMIGRELVLLKKISERLLEIETLDADEFSQIMGQSKVVRPGMIMATDSLK